MTQEDLKHAMISLVLGVLVTAASSLVLGLLHIAQVWLSGFMGGGGATVAYIYRHYHIS